MITQVTMAACAVGFALIIALHMVQLWHAMGDRRATAECLEGLADVCQGSSDVAGAVRLLGAAAALRESIRCPIPICDLEQHGRKLAALRAMWGEEGFAAAWAEGHAMTLEDGVAYALRETGDQETQSA
jgi:hypothetical protein